MSAYPLGEAVWEQGVGWTEIASSGLSFGERMTRALNCQAGYPSCPYEGKAHQHDLERTVHGHVLTLFVSDPDSAMGASGMFFVGERGQQRGGGVHTLYLDEPPHSWNDPDGDGHGCVDCRPDDDRRCSREGHPA